METSSGQGQAVASPRSFDWGGRIPKGGGTNSGESKPPTSKFRFLLGFRPPCFGDVGKSENFNKYPEKFISKSRYLGDIPPNFEAGGRVRRGPPAGGGAHEIRLNFQFKSIFLHKMHMSLAQNFLGIQNMSLVVLYDA